MSPQLIGKVLEHNWFVATQMKGIRRSQSPATDTFQSSNALRVLHGIENAAAKFIRAMSLHQKSWLCIIIYCIVISLNLISFASCDIAQSAGKNRFTDDEQIGANILPNPLKHAIDEDNPAILNADVDKFEKSTNNENNINNNVLGDVTFLHAFITSLSVIVVSELGDKTFFIAAIMAMRHPRLIVFLGAISALALMTALSAVFGQLANLVPRIYTYWISTALFAIFGLKMLHDGYHMSPNDAQEEFDEVQSDLKKREDEIEKETATSTTLLPDVESAVITVVDDPQIDVNATTPASNRKPKKSRRTILTRVLVQAFSMTFLAEWGDRSQLTTIILAARDNVYGVIVGGVLGHALCTGLAVIGGRMIAQRISVRTVTIIGGIVFICFAFSAFFISPNEEADTDIRP